MGKIVRWIAEHGRGLEHLSLAFRESLVMANSVVIGERGGTPYGLVYTVSVDAEWRTRLVDIASPSGSPSLRLWADGHGRWRDVEADRDVPALDGCIDVDIAATPFTNTLPIRRLPWQAGQSRTLRMAYISVPDLTPSAMTQRYTCLEPFKWFLYENLDGVFQAQLELDNDGLVIDYPGLFTRVP
ncbi:putative glycolipid-binding domain-containing protein [Pseudomonas sp. NPDC007930]|uniref:putative glycolipid-binding domain-containing protein n=1 Tax=Pseudomonas sp. NPDC007930 TaxID=3364417 RepID=UPI0036EF8190